MDLFASGASNRSRDVDEMLSDTNDDVDETLDNNNSNKRNSNEMSDTNTTGETPSIRRKLIMEPIDPNLLNQQKFTRFTEIKLTDLADNTQKNKRKGYLDLQLLRVIANGSSKQQNQVRYYKSADKSKKIKSVAYKRLFMFRIISNVIADTTNNMVYIIEDD